MVHPWLAAAPRMCSLKNSYIRLHIHGQGMGSNTKRPPPKIQHIVRDPTVKGLSGTTKTTSTLGEKKEIVIFKRFAIKIYKFDWLFLLVIRILFKNNQRQKNWNQF